MELRYNGSMHTFRSVTPVVLILAPSLSLLASCKQEPDKAAATECATEVSWALAECTTMVSDLHGACLQATDALCAPSDAAVENAYNNLRSRVDASCNNSELFDAAGSARVDGLVAACAQESTSLVGRLAGGPHAAVWAEASDAERTCIETARAAVTEQLEIGLTDIFACAGQGVCSESTIQEARAGVQDITVLELEDACPDLAEMVAIDARAVVDRTARQVDCLAATARPDLEGLGLTCGPSYADFDAPRGEWTQVVVDASRWGSLCGDGTDYAFWIRPAPEGAPLDNVLIGLEGGGVCVFAEDCGARQQSAPQLFSALDNAEPIAVGIASDNPAESPFSDWTRVFLPYCTQDVFAGGGVDEDLGGGVVVPRYGSVNARAAISMVRDWMWRELEADPDRPEGYRADTVHALFGGWSAGSYGTLYNYHWMLDDLGWAHTTAFPDAGLALDNGEALGVRALGAVKIPAWGALPNLPPYCFDGDCALGEVLAEALSPRLLSVPEQQLLMLSNQLDDIQAGDAYFSTREGFVNALRHTYCDTKDLPGVAWYLTGVSDESVHVVTVRPELWSGSVGGMVMSDWLAKAAIDGQEVDSYAEEGDFQTVVSGVEAFPCPVD